MEPSAEIAGTPSPVSVSKVNNIAMVSLMYYLGVTIVSLSLVYGSMVIVVQF